MSLTKVVGCIFGVLVIMNALLLIGTGISIFAVLTFGMAGLSIIMNALEI